MSEEKDVLILAISFPLRLTCIPYMVELYLKSHQESI